MFRKEDGGTFFPWPWEPEGSGQGITLRLLNGERMRELDRATMRARNVVIDGQLYKDPVIDEDLRERMRLDMVVVDWTGLRDAAGAEVPCTPETKVEWMRGSLELARFVGKKLDELRAIVDERTERAAKN